MIFTTFDQLLGLDATCPMAIVQDAAMLILGDRADALVAEINRGGRATIETLRARILFGLPILTAPFPLLVGGLMTERNTPLNQLSLFGWIADHYIDQPRAEIFGLTPFAEQPVLFLRDFDMDRPVEAWFQSLQPTRWVRVAAVAIATAEAGEPQELRGDRAALALMAHALPDDARAFVDGISLDCARGGSLRAALRARRKITDAALMNACDGWRVLAEATAVVRLDPTPEREQPIEEVLRLAPEKKW